MIARAGMEGIDIPRLIERTGMHQDLLKKILDVMYSQRKAVHIDSDGPNIFSFQDYQNLQEKILSETRSYHKKYPLREGIMKEELRNTMGSFISSKLFNMAIRELEKNGKMVVDREVVRLQGHSVNLKGKLEDIRTEIAAFYMASGLTPPTVREIITKYEDQKDEVENVLGIMLKEGVLVRINEELYFHRDALQKLRENYRNLLMKEGKATPAGFKELTGLTRKFIIPLMEYFDMTKLTVRAGDHRILREREGK